MRTVILVLIVILLTGCRSKKVITTVNSEKEIIQETDIKKAESKIEKAEYKEQSKKTEISDQKKESQTDFEIRGKAETGIPIEIYNVQNGDTLQAIRVTGNADVHIRTKASLSDLVKKESTSESLVDKVKEFSENIVSENNVKERVRVVKQKAREIKTKGFQAGLWIWLGIISVVGIIVFAIYKYFKQK